MESAKAGLALTITQHPIWLNGETTVAARSACHAIAQRRRVGALTPWNTATRHGGQVTRPGYIGEHEMDRLDLLNMSGRGSDSVEKK
jgi:hypothetical protein